MAFQFRAGISQTVVIQASPNNLQLTINDLAKGSRGFLWRASEKGFFRFDGSDCIPIFSEIINSEVRGLGINGDLLYAAVKNNVFVLNTQSGTLGSLFYVNWPIAHVSNIIEKKDGVCIVTPEAIYEVIMGLSSSHLLLKSCLSG